MGLLKVFASFENLFRDFAATRTGTTPDARSARLFGAAVVAAFRVGLRTWIDSEAALDLPSLITDNVETLTQALLRS
ncbi:hypothetical protein Raf01_61650 [Rugosimonospora africana]|uniref:MftR C-terminal domain-containing protein n=1 Tax=Rugosimonospora africana TaxID=556532 RepID=A0A8J3QY54_9ACTN|nr:hypothetical protein Raf01_61650 [Rugosimonospora africana]